MSVKVLFLDYDGVIADSMGAKAEALADAFAPTPAIAPGWPTASGAMPGAAGS